MSMPMPGRRRRSTPGAWLIAAGAAAAAAGTATAIVALIMPRPPAGPAPGPSPSRPRTAPVRVPTPPAGTTVSTAGWRSASVDGAMVPVSSLAGPARRSGGLASGFADTPAGSVLAAVNIAVRVSGQLGPDVFVPTIGRQVTGPAATTLLAAAWKEYGQASQQSQPQVPDGPAGQATATVTSFLLAAWSPAEASVTVTSAADDSQAEAAISVSVRWLDGDWRLVAPAGGEFTGAPVASRVPAGFTPLPALGR